MTASTHTTFTGPQYYDEYLGPVQFQPFAHYLAMRLPARPPGDVLELACGTGLLTRELRTRLEPGVKIIATDLSKPMLDYAAAKVPLLEDVEWREANMMQLPFEDGRFGAVVAAFGIMFAPDRGAALKEARRVLHPGGWLALSVWDRLEENSASFANAQAIEALFRGDAEMKFRLPYEMCDGDATRRLIESAGFGEVKIEKKRYEFSGADPRKIAIGQVRGTPRSAMIEKKGVALEEAIDRVAESLAAHGGSPYRGHVQGFLITARAA
ncbi:MAG: methyltransferase domain-containing protein [Ramlibacter sp.]|nr:methyltransferase domain-containing protein [Ramlibacter sp.]